MRQLLPVADSLDLSEHWTNRCVAALLDGRFVHKAGVVVGDLAFLGAKPASLRAHLLDQIGGPLLIELPQLGDDTPSTPIRRDLRLLEPGSIGKFEEVIAGLDAKIHVRNVEVR